MKVHFTRYIILNLIWIIFCFIVIIWGDKLPIEFSSPFLQSIFVVSICVGLTISIILTGNQIFQFKSNAFTVITIVLSLPIVAIVFFGRTMCRASDEILYTNLHSPSTIVARSFGCGAWDSDFPKYSYYKKMRLLNIFYLNIKVDTSTLDKSVWIKRKEQFPNVDFLKQ